MDISIAGFASATSMYSAGQLGVIEEDFLVTDTL